MTEIGMDFGDRRYSGGWQSGRTCQRSIGDWYLTQSQRSSRGLILDQMGSQQSDGDLDNLTT